MMDALDVVRSKKNWRGSPLACFALALLAGICASTTVAQEPVEVPQDVVATDVPVTPIAEAGPVTGAGRFGQAGPGDEGIADSLDDQPDYLSGNTPFLQRFRQALAYEQPTSPSRGALTGSGRFGQAGPADYGEVEEGPGFLDVLFPETTRRLRERYNEDGDAAEVPEEPLPPTFLTRLNQLFFNQIVADATLPISIRNPGPDSANFTNSAYTLERGHVYAEFQPVQITGLSETQPYNYSFGYLFRFGVTDRVEFRLISNGFTYQSTFHGNKRSGVGPQPSASGWSPFGIDFKVNFWEQRIRSLMPAMGMEIVLITETGSAPFQNGVATSANLLFDYNFGRGWNLEWNIGIQPSSLSKPNMNYLYTQQFKAQWALQKSLTDDLAVYFHGYYGDSAFPQYDGSTVVGAGALYYIGKKWSVWGNYNVGVEKYVGPSFLYNIGFAYAF